MQFESWSAFWHMGGYGFYVWLAFAVTLLSLVGIVVESLWAKRALVSAARKEFARRERIKAARKQRTQSEQAENSQEVSGS